MEFNYLSQKGHLSDVAWKEFEADALTLLRYGRSLKESYREHLEGSEIIDMTYEKINLSEDNHGFSLKTNMKSVSFFQKTSSTTLLRFSTTNFGDKSIVMGLLLLLANKYPDIYEVDSDLAPDDWVPALRLTRLCLKEDLKLIKIFGGEDSDFRVLESPCPFELAESERETLSEDCLETRRKHHKRL